MGLLVPMEVWDLLLVNIIHLFLMQYLSESSLKIKIHSSFSHPHAVSKSV